MDPSLAWAIAGLALVIVELLTGTFYLVMLGVAAFGAALAAWLGLEFGPQIIVFAVVSAAGCYGVHAYRSKNKQGQMTPIDSGMPATFESWVDEAGRRARVRYRGASWEAVVEGAGSPVSGNQVYVMNIDGNTLKVSAQRPA
jgi:membrane protein implicated in regulation of membrane protease activity